MGIDMDMTKAPAGRHAPAATSVLASERGAAGRSMARQGKGAPRGVVKRIEAGDAAETGSRQAASRACASSSDQRAS